MNVANRRMRGAVVVSRGRTLDLGWATMVRVRGWSANFEPLVARMRRATVHRLPRSHTSRVASMIRGDVGSAMNVQLVTGGLVHPYSYG
uniref:DUF2088 domain-containing protein n=1 Tax=Panagrellus redivivus TaxID=6233 RepID=A0A7E4ZZU6_PANRE